jgi:hypothetical protein
MEIIGCGSRDLRIYMHVGWEVFVSREVEGGWGKGFVVGISVGIYG